jgi:hypothetical protein
MNRLIRRAVCLALVPLVVGHEALAQTPASAGNTVPPSASQVELASVSRIGLEAERRPEPCLAALNQALGQDVKAAQAQAEKKPWREIERFFAQAEQAWADAAAGCQGPMRDQALIHQSDARRGRDRAANMVGDSPACDQAVGTANRIMEFSAQSWSEKRWEDAARWLRKADLAWDAAVGQCGGAKREQASQKRDAARLDAHNAVSCAPLWEQATGLTAKLKDETAILNAVERTQRRDQIEVLWTEAASSCKGASADRAAAAAALMAGERGSRALPVVAGAASGRLEGTRSRVDDITYVGQFRPNAKGEMEGLGRVEWDNGDVFDGSLVKGHAEGKGVFTWKNGQRYEGDLLEGRPAGQGKLLYAETGDIYEGEFAVGLPHGRGVYTWKNGDSYRGDWVKGKKHGRGRYASAKGGSWDGEYANDERVKGVATISRAVD